MSIKEIYFINFYLHLLTIPLYIHYCLLSAFITNTITCVLIMNIQSYVLPDSKLNSGIDAGANQRY